MQPHILARRRHPRRARGSIPRRLPPGALNYGQALAMATLLMLLCAAAVLLLERLEKVLG